MYDSFGWSGVWNDRKFGGCGGFRSNLSRVCVWLLSWYVRRRQFVVFLSWCLFVLGGVEVFLVGVVGLRLAFFALLSVLTNLFSLLGMLKPFGESTKTGQGLKPTSPVYSRSCSYASSILYSSEAIYTMDPGWFQRLGQSLSWTPGLWAGRCRFGFVLPTFPCLTP